MCCIFLARQKSVKIVAHGPLNVKNAPTVNGALTAYLAHFLMQIASTAKSAKMVQGIALLVVVTDVVPKRNM